MSVVVVSTSRPNPALYVVLFAAPLIVTVEFPTVPFEMVITPLPLDVWLDANVLILTIVPVPLLTSGLAFGKLVSFAIGTNPPTSSTKSTIRSLIAAVVAIVVSLSGNASPSLIVSPVLTLKYLASAAEVVKNVESLAVTPDCSPAVTITASSILSIVT